MADIRDMLYQELEQRRAQSMADNNKLRELADQREAIAEADLSTDIAPTVGFIDNLTGTNSARFVNRQPDIRSDLKDALAARQAARGPGFVGLADKLLRDEQQENKLRAAGGRRKLSGEQLKRLDSAQMANDALVDIQSALEQGQSIIPESLTAVTGDNLFTDAARRFAEGFGRMQSGAAISKDEEKRFMRLLPRITDSAQVRATKMQNLRKEIQRRVSGIEGGSVTPAAPIGGSDLDAQIAQLEAELAGE